MGSSLTIGIRAGGQQMEQMRESSTRCKLWGLGSVGGKWVRNLLCSSSHLLRFPLQEEKKKKKALSKWKPSMNASWILCWLQNDSLINLPSENHHQVLPAQCQITPKQEGLFFYKNHTVAQWHFPKHEPGSLLCFPKEPQPHLNQSLSCANFPIPLCLKPARAGCCEEGTGTKTCKKGALQLGNVKYY